MTRRRVPWLVLSLLAGAAAAGAVGRWYASGGAPEREPLFAEPPARTRPAETRIAFADARRSGVAFVHRPHRSEHKYMPEVFGSGVAVADFNRDGAPDLFFVNSGKLTAADTARRPASAQNRLYINDGDAHFTDRTEAWDVPSRGYGMGAAAGDYNNDGWVDLYLTGFDGAAALLKNTGDGFVDVTARAGVGAKGWSSSAGFLDMEGDGDLDLYVVRYVRYTRETAVGCYRGDHLGYCTPALYHGLRDRLYRNDGDGTFTEVGEAAGLPKAGANGLALGIHDVNRDGAPDIYVANDLTPNHLLIGDGEGHFRDEAPLAGVAYGEHGAEQAGMGVDFADVNHDGRNDIVCTNFQGEPTNLYLQEKGFFFHDRADAYGVGRTARARLSFGVAFLDADNDGDEDLAVANGHIQDIIGSYSDAVSFAQRNQLYENRDGRFVDVSAAAGPPFTEKRVSRGLATGDLDGDGRLDLVVNNNGGRARVALNRTADAGRFVSLRLEGRSSNRSAIGAVVTARAGDRRLRRAVAGAGSYQSTSDRRIHLGLGAAAAAEDVIIRWPSGTTQSIGDLEAGRFYRVVEGKAPGAYEPGAQRLPAPATRPASAIRPGGNATK